MKKLTLVGLNIVEDFLVECETLRQTFKNVEEFGEAWDILQIVTNCENTIMDILENGL